LSSSVTVLSWWVCFSVTELLACARFLRVRFWFNRHHLLAVVVSVCVWLLLIPSPASLWLWWFRYVAAPGCGGSGWCRFCSAKTGFFMSPVLFSDCRGVLPLF
jgi:hypothetical protein